MLKSIAFACLILALVYNYFLKPPPALKADPSQLLVSYDYVIVGAGTAGCILAARLSENPAKTVLLIEAGDAPPYWIHIPGFAADTQRSAYDWQFQTVPQTKASQSMIDKRSQWPRGKVLGGSNMLNFMQFTRGHPADYDRWATLVGDEEWGYKRLLPYFKKLENLTIDELRDPEYRGTSGPVRVAYSSKTKFGDVFIEAAKSLGFPSYADYNGANTQAGFSFAQATVAEGLRQSTYLTYLKPAMAVRPNLHVLPKAHVTKVIFDRKRAIGVSYVFDKMHFTVRSSQEVILSAGAVGSPQLLMLSGIGIKKDLEALGIECLVDLPVGKNLLDHVGIDLSLAFDVERGRQLMPEHFASDSLVKSAFEYLLYRTGPLAHAIPELIGFWSSGLTNDTRPDIEFVVVPAIFSIFQRIFCSNANLNDETCSATYGAGADRPAAQFLVFLSHPKSPGEIKLASSKPADRPVIDPKYLHNDLDAKIMREGTVELKQYGAEVGEQPLPACKKWTHMSDDYLDCLVRQRTFTVYHPTCTCRMGKSSRDSVLDNQLRVHGIQGLRVVDASAFPDQVSGNTNAPVMMLAEKAVDIILRV